MNPKLREHIMRSGVTCVRLATVAGFAHKQTLNGFLHAPSLPATPATLTHLHRIADAIGFPRYDLFLDEVAR